MQAQNQIYQQISIVTSSSKAKQIPREGESLYNSDIGCMEIRNQRKVLGGLRRDEENKKGPEITLRPFSESES
jgi:hypothetical protein